MTLRVSQTALVYCITISNFKLSPSVLFILTTVNAEIDNGHFCFWGTIDLKALQQKQKQGLFSLYANCIVLALLNMKFIIITIRDVCIQRSGVAVGRGLFLCVCVI